ncbi:MAG: hypothetical protein HOI10_01495 [Deltaproteobacteria bacterium]|nr:hypothetical protein [Deltaproteobacteria bacterium]
MASISFTVDAIAEPSTENYNETLHVGVVGDTGVGERAYHPGFIAVTKALKNHRPDLLLHLGDFVYQPKIFPQTCPERYLREIRKTLADPFKFKLFVPGDNDLPPNRKKPKGSGCWKKIDMMDSNFDSYPISTHKPRAYEGTMTIGNTFFAILNTYPWQNPKLWLAPRIQKAKEQGLWTIIALHEPPITTAWYLDKRDTVLKQLTALKPDLVFSGNQHSYERFHQIKTPKQDGLISFILPTFGNYLKGDGTIYVVSGGGGAAFKPFADQQELKKRIAPKTVFDALATRALMNHFLILKIKRETLQAITYRVCPEISTKNVDNPRWKAGKSVWSTIRLECEGQEEGVTAFDQFQIQLKKGDTLKDKTN